MAGNTGRLPCIAACQPHRNHAFFIKLNGLYGQGAGPPGMSDQGVIQIPSKETPEDHTQRPTDGDDGSQNHGTQMNYKKYPGQKMRYFYV